MVLDGMHAYTVARSVTFYEQSLVDAMRINNGKERSDWELMDVHANGAGGDLKLSDMTDISAQRMEEVDAQNSSAESSSDSKAQPKLSDIDGRTSLVSSTTLSTLKLTKPAKLGITPSQSKQKAQGKYSRLRHELSMVMHAGYDETVCVVMVVGGTAEHPNQNLLEYPNVSPTNDSYLFRLKWGDMRS